MEEVERERDGEREDDGPSGFVEKPCLRQRAQRG